MEQSTVIILVADGLHPDVLDTAMAAGDVPELSALRDAGGRHELTTVYPSVTGVAYLPILTGWHPATAGIPGLRWYDRSRRLPSLLGHSRSYLGPQLRRIDIDLAPAARPVFEFLPGQSLGSMAMVSRGLGRASRLDQGWLFVARLIRAHLAGDVARLLSMEEGLAGQLVARVRRERPRFVFAAFTTGDKATHAAGRDSPLARRSLRLIDRVVGDLRRDAERDGRWKGMHLWVVSDHGHAPVSSHLDLAGLLRDAGLRVRAHPWTVPDRSDSAIMVSGNSMAHVYLGLDARERQPWASLAARWHSRIGGLWTHRAIDLIAAMRSGSTVEVWKGGANALIQITGDRLSYRPIHGNPLGIDPFEGACDVEAHERSSGSPYPDAVYQLARLTLAPRSGDLVIGASPGWDLRLGYEPVRHVSSHGALHAAHMLVPFLSSRRLVGAPRRTADLFDHVAAALRITPAVSDRAARLSWASRT